MSYESITATPRVRRANPQSVKMALKGIDHRLEGPQAETAFRLLFGDAPRDAFDTFKDIARRDRN